MALFDFIQRLLGLQKPSAATAKERLQLVLAHDRSDLNPELLEQMRREILEVVQKYVEIDLDSGDVSLATEDRVTALVATLPIRRAKAISLSRPNDLPLAPSVPSEAAADGQAAEGASAPPSPADSSVEGHSAEEGSARESSTEDNSPAEDAINEPGENPKTDS
jgi:cell division topological specificity factor